MNNLFCYFHPIFIFSHFQNVELIFRYILVITFWDWNNLFNSSHAKFVVMHGWRFDMTSMLFKHLLCIVRDIASLLPFTYASCSCGRYNWNIYNKFDYSWSCWFWLIPLVMAHNFLFWISMLIYWKRSYQI
jgi:hypothetical protein